MYPEWSQKGTEGHRGSQRTTVGHKGPCEAEATCLAKSVDGAICGQDSAVAGPGSGPSSVRGQEWDVQQVIPWSVDRLTLQT